MLDCQRDNFQWIYVGIMKQMINFFGKKLSIMGILEGARVQDKKNRVKYPFSFLRYLE